MSLPARAGVGFKPEHFEAIRATAPAVGFLEVHAENYMGAGGLPHAQLAALRADHALSLHGVGLSIGGADPLDRDHLQRLRALCDRYQPESFSEHLAWSSHGGEYLNDLLPLPYTQDTLARVSAHVAQVQDVLGRRILLENPSTYVLFEQSTMPEVEFLAQLAARTGCGLLLDVNNVFVSATNHRTDPMAYVAAFPLDAVAEIHLGGHDAEQLPSGPLLIDAHGSPVADPVWALYRAVLGRTGPLPTLIEWDNDVPDWPVLLAEAGARRPFWMHSGGPALPAPADPLAAFAAGLASGVLPPGVTATAPDEAARRFAVYRNTVAVGLADALAKRFPVIGRLVGAEFFRAMARVYLQDNRPRSPVLLDWGDSFPGFLAGFPPLAAHPYMADVARIELARGRAHHAADAAPLSPEQLVAAAANPATARIGLHPSVQLLHLSHPAVSIWAANQPGAAPAARPAGPQVALILRDRSYGVPVTTLGAGDAALVAALLRGDALLAAAEQARRADPSHDPQPLLIRLVQAGAVTQPKEMPCVP